MYERIPGSPRLRPSSPTTAKTGRIMLRVDPTAFARGTRIDLEKHGYEVISRQQLELEELDGDAIDAILYFHHTADPTPVALLEALPKEIPLLLITVGFQPVDPELRSLAERPNCHLLMSKWGPSLDRVLAALSAT